MENKSFWQIIKGSFLGTDGEGSGKRMASFYFTIVLLTSMIAIEEYCYYLAAISTIPTTVQTIIVRSHEPILFSLLLTLWIFFGFTSADKVIDFVKFIKGDKKEEVK